MTIEDSTSLREMISFVLKEAGYIVLEAKDGMDAMARLKIEKVDLIITDQNMPKMTGIELTQAIRTNSINKFTPIIFLSTESMVDKKEKAKEVGATGWLVKPFTPEKLVNVVNKVLGPQKM